MERPDPAHRCKETSWPFHPDIAIALGLAAASCAQSKVDSPVESTTAAVTAAATGTSPGKLDVLFMIDDSSSMTSMQQKLAAQIPAFVSALQNLPMGLPSLHIAVVSSDMGAPGDSTFALQCTARGDQGEFRLGTDGQRLRWGASGGDAGALGCPGASLNSGATYISNVDGVANYTGDLSTLLSCMTTLGDTGCGFENQLASISRALGADGSPAPSSNAGFLRPDAQLAIIVLSNEDDCSAPVNTQLYSLNGGQQNIANPAGADRQLSLQPVRPPVRRSGRRAVDLPHGAAASTTDRRADDGFGADAGPARLCVRRHLRAGHLGQQLRDRNQGAQGRSRQSDRRRRDRGACDPLHRRLGPGVGRTEHATR